MNKKSIFESALEWGSTSAKSSPHLAKRLSEGFRYDPQNPQQQFEIATKLVNVIARKVGTSAVLSQIPYAFSRHGEEYVGYLAFTKDGRAFRFTFALEGESQRVASVEVYNEPKSLEQPDTTITILDTTMNVVRVADVIAQALTGDVEDLATSADVMVEASPIGTRLHEGKKDDMTRFFQETGSKDYTEYVQWAMKNGMTPGSSGLFSTTWKLFVAMGGAERQGTGISARTGAGIAIAPSDPEAPLYDPEDADVFEDDMSQDAIRKFEFYDAQVRGMAHGDPELWAMFVYGNPGLGKSFNIKRILLREELGALKKSKLKVEIKSGAISGFTGLIKVLYDHRKDYILILDDNDNLLVKNIAAANILKASLQTEVEERRVTYSRADFSELFAAEEDGGDFEEEEGADSFFGGDEEELEELRSMLSTSGGLHIYERSGKMIFEAAKVPIQLNENDRTDQILASSKDSIRDFYFQSRIIFVSNLMFIPPAVGDRCIKINMVFTPEQVLELIRENMSKMDIKTVTAEQLPLETRMAVYDFMKRSRAEIERRVGKQLILTYRMFRNSCIVYDRALVSNLGMSTAKRWIIGQLEADLGASR